MIEILIYSVLTLLIFFIGGLGLSLILTPNSLKNYVLWLSPWYFITLTIPILIISGLCGIPANYLSPLILLLTATLTIYELLIHKNTFKLFILRDILIVIFIAANIIFNSSPLLVRDKYLTTLSLGSNDVIAYASSADYLKKNSLIKSFNQDVILTIDNLLHDGFRWGPSISEAYFLNILNLEAFQYTYLYEVILFALMVPLVYILFGQIFKPSLLMLILIFLMTGFNVNLLYMLYHNFFGLISFWGISVFLLILFINKFGNLDNKYKHFDLEEFVISISIVTLYFTYHEGAFFILFPLFLYLVYLFILKRKYIAYLKSLTRTAFSTLLIGSVSIINAFIFDFGQAFKGNPNQPIGWQLFRSKFPFANPFEILGFYSIHNFPPILNLLAIILSLLVLLIILNGFKVAKYRNFIFPFILVDLLLLFWVGYAKNNFFDYNRVVTYTLPLFIVLFCGGFYSLFKKNKSIKILFLAFSFSLIIFSAFSLNKRFITERLSVEKSFISLSEIKKLNINEPIYAGGYVDDSIPLWQQIWIGYFIYPNIKTSKIYPNLFINDKFMNKVPDNQIVLLQKKVPWVNPTNLVLRKIIWENKDYKLGRICNTAECLSSSTLDLSNLKIGESEVEDSILITGWSSKEGSYRWANALESTLRLISRADQHPQRLIIEARSLKSPQKISLFINDIFIEEINLSNIWNKYTFNLPYIPTQLYNITFKYSNLYRPVDLGLNLDNRELSVSFKTISLE